MKKLILPLFVVVVVVLSSCTSKEQKQQLAKIDTLNLTLDTISNKLETIDSAAVRKNFLTILENNDLLDSIPVEKQDKELISLHRSVERTYRRYMSNATRMKTELEKSYNQLDSLSYDVKHDLVPEGKFKYYYDDEKEAVNRLRNLSFYIIETSKKELNRFDSLQTAIDKHLNEHGVQRE